MALFCMAGGGTGGHVIPALAVAHELKARGHEVYFVGTERGVENRLVPAEGFPIEYVQLGGLKNVNLLTKAASLWGLLRGTWTQFRRFSARRPDAVFSMGGYVAGPPVLAAVLHSIPLVVMEPNAVPGFTNRHIARWVKRALVNFPETERFFPAGRAEVTGRPVREEFFAIPAQSCGGGILTVLITGGSQGSRTLNHAARDSWARFKNAGTRVRLIHQTGAPMFDELKRGWDSAGLDGEISPFISDMPAAFARADLIVCRSGGTVSEIAAAGKPSVMIPFPFAADQHQLKNAEAFERAGACRMFLDKDWNGERMFSVVTQLGADREQLAAMGDAARKLAKPGAAARAADVLVGVRLNRALKPLTMAKVTRTIH